MVWRKTIIFSGDYIKSAEMNSFGKISSYWRLDQLVYRHAVTAALQRAKMHVYESRFTWMTPPPFPPVEARNSLGNSSIFPSQSIITTSSSVHAGLAIWIKQVLLISKLTDTLHYIKTLKRCMH
jgi:hypothetical protein